MAKGISGKPDVSRSASTMRIELFVRDFARSLEFYERALGFVVDPARERRDDYIPIRHGDVSIGLGALELLPASHYFKPTREGQLGVGVEIVLEVEGLADYEQKARRTNAVVEPTQLRSWGLLDFRVIDPDGYYIRVTERP
jgi:lactoylglutathione lyase